MRGNPFPGNWLPFLRRSSPNEAEPEPEKGEIQQEILRGSGRILFVDDEEHVRDMATDILTDLGYEVITCKNGEEALAYYSDHFVVIDLAIIDLIMPVQNGYDCFLEMKRINPGIKALICSGYTVNHNIEKILEKGALGFIPKPFEIPQFSTAVHKELNS